VLDSRDAVPHTGCVVEIPPAEHPTRRLVSLDAFRGAVMLLMASSGFGVAKVASAFPESGFWRWLASQTEHSAWVGCTCWDLIQPCFMFMVGVAVPWSVAARRGRGDSTALLFRHAAARSALLVGLGVFLTSAWSARTEWVFVNVLAQIGLGYPALFAVALRGPRSQWGAAGALLFICWIAFALNPAPAHNTDWDSLGVPPDWQHLSGFAAHWEKNANVAKRFDYRFLNLFPRETPFTYNEGGYATLNFVPSIATMIFGVRAGELLKADLSIWRKVTVLASSGFVGIAAGAALDAAGVCPMVKRLWTPSWTLFSAGWAAVLLAGFAATIEGGGVRRWAFPFVVAGVNPLALYLLWQLSDGFLRHQIRTHLGPGVFSIVGARYAPIMERVWVVALMWSILFWMYRRRVHLRV
jgi:heparan-alpha-glucosaminide N-acetyltransferase